MTQPTTPKVVIRHYPFSQLCELAEPDRKPDVVYEFSNGRKFESTDATDSGIYE